MTEPDAALPDLYRPVVSSERTESRRAESALIAACVLGVAGVVFGLAGAPHVIAGGMVALGAVSYVTSRVVVRRSLGAARSIADDHARAVAMISEGRLEEAARIVDVLLVRARTSAPSHAVLLVLRAALFARMNDATRARGILVAVHDSKLLDGAADAIWSARVRGALALVDSVGGDLDSAEAWLAPLAEVVSADVTCELTVPRAVLDARSGRYAAVIASIDRATAAFTLGEPQKKTLAVLRAFSLEMGDDAGDTRADVEQSLRDAGPIAPWEIDYLRASWPTLTSFCERHKLGAR